MTKISERMCAVCRTKKPKLGLFRFLVQDSKMIFDKNGGGVGRGFYICSKECWDMAKKQKRKVKISSTENKYISIPNIDFGELIG